MLENASKPFFATTKKWCKWMIHRQSTGYHFCFVRLEGSTFPPLFIVLLYFFISFHVFITFPHIICALNPTESNLFIAASLSQLSVVRPLPKVSHPRFPPTTSSMRIDCQIRLHIDKKDKMDKIYYIQYKMNLYIDTIYDFIYIIMRHYGMCIHG